MDEARQKIQGSLALAREPKGEALGLARQGAEASMAERETESLAEGEPLMERVCERENRQRALAQVKRNQVVREWTA